LTGFNTGLSNSFSEINKLKTELESIANKQIQLQKESKDIIDAQNSLATKTAEKLAKALEGFPETITFKIEGLQDINLKFNLTSAEEDIQNIKNEVATQVSEYIKNALNTAGFSISSFTFPVGRPTP
jgi:predicted transcriptional regulator